MFCRKIDLHQIHSHHNLQLLLHRGRNLPCLLKKYLRKLLKRLQILEQNRHAPQFFFYIRTGKMSCVVLNFLCYNEKKIQFTVYLTSWLCSLLTTVNLTFMSVLFFRIRHIVHFTSRQGLVGLECAAAGFIFILISRAHC